MSMASKFGKSIVNMFTNDKKSNAAVQATTAAAELEATQEAARKEGLKLLKTARFGFPYKPTCMAYDVVQRVLAIGTRNGYVKIYGGESIEYSIFHVSSLGSSAAASSSSSNSSLVGSPVVAASASPLAFPAAVLFMSFIINEGALITYCDDNTLSFWNLRQKQPGLLYSKKLVNEKATAMHLPFQSNWLYIGTEKGNTYVLNVYNNFSQSGYDIKWNNVIELSQKTKPGKVIHLSDHPLDSSKLLIGFDSGLIVLWNMKLKRGEMRFYGTAETMSSISWFYDGKQFMSSHNNGSLILWSCKGDTKPVNILHPHMNEADLIPQYNMIKKVAWEANKAGEPLIIFSDGLPSADCSMKDAITIIKNNKLKTIIEMKDRIIDFIIVNTNPWTSENPPDPCALIILLENNLVVIDLKTDGFPQFNHHHATNLHDVPISACQYIVDPHWSLFQNLMTVKEKHLQSRQSIAVQQSNTNQMLGATTSVPFFSQLPYPINGGLKCPKPNTFAYNELLLTGHEDGSVKIWDTSGIGINLVYKLKTQKLFNKRQCEMTNMPVETDTPFKITALASCNGFLAAAGCGGYVNLYKFNPKNLNPTDELADIPLMEIPINYENNQESKSQNELNSNDAKKDLKSFLRAKIGFRRQSGYNLELVCLLLWNQRPPVVNSIVIYPRFNMLLFGMDEGIVGVDFINRQVYFNLSLSDLNVPGQELTSKGQRSPKKSSKSAVEREESESNELSTANLTKQFTIDNSFLQSSLRETSRSSSSSSLENLSSSEGIFFIAINENSTIPSNKMSENQQNTIQIWVGTNYGSAIVLNCSGYSNTNGTINANTASPSSSNPNDLISNKSELETNNQITKSFALTPNTIIQLKGQILEIAFLDLNGNLYSPINSNNNYITNSNKVKLAYNASAGSNSSTGNTNTNTDSGDLDMDFNFIANAQILSNSIADNFYNSSTTINNNNVSTSSSNETGSNLSSPSTAFNTHFINLNQQPQQGNDDKEILTNFSGSVKIKDDNKFFKTNKKSLGLTKSSKHDFNVTQDLPDKNQFVVICSEFQIKVISIPSQTCLYKYAITEGTIAKSTVILVNSLAYLSCCLTNGNFLVFNLPNLKPNLNVSLSPISREKDLLERLGKTFTFGSRGHSLYMCSSSEIQKLYLSSSNSNNDLTEMLSELFDPKIPTPPAPKPNIFKTIFSVTPLDREELFGESSGKPSTCIVKNIDSDVLRTKGELSELHKLALQRGEKLSALQLKTEEMTQAASAYAKTAHELANKYKKSSKWL